MEAKQFKIEKIEKLTDVLKATFFLNDDSSLDGFSSVMKVVDLHEFFVAIDKFFKDKGGLPAAKTLRCEATTNPTLFRMYCSVELGEFIIKVDKKEMYNFYMILRDYFSANPVM